MRFSLVLPVCNVKPYLAECLDSICAQSYTDWEAICVDDGSTDGSAALLDAYAAWDIRIRVVHQSNAGVSAARNRGIDQACGDYVIFVDPDDWLSSMLLEEAATRLVSWNSDVLIWDCMLTEGRHEERYSFADRDVPEISEEQREDMLRFLILMKEERLLEVAGPWCKAYRRTLLAQHRFRPGLKMSEDRVFNFGIYDDRSLRLSYLHTPGYHYRVRSGSAVKSFSSDRLDRGISYLLALDELDAGRHPELIGREMWRVMWENCGSYEYKVFARRIVRSDVRHLLRRVLGEREFERKDRLLLWCIRRRIILPRWLWKRLYFQ